MRSTIEKKAQRETWREWLPFDLNGKTIDLLTRDEIVAELQQHGVDVSQDNIRSWEHLGILPQGERRWHDGATRTLYPSVLVHTITYLRSLQAIGFPLDVIRPELQRDLALRIREHVGLSYAEITTPEPNLGLPDYVVRVLTTAAKHRVLFDGSHVVRIKMTLETDEGSQVEFRLSKGPDDQWHVLQCSLT
jgi:DNA-binding transcriptional MerR regulator